MPMKKSQWTSFTAALLSISLFIASFSVAHIHELEPSPEQVGFEAVQHETHSADCSLCWMSTAMDSAELANPFLVQAPFCVLASVFSDCSVFFSSRLLLLANLRAPPASLFS